MDKLTLWNYLGYTNLVFYNFTRHNFGHMDFAFYLGS